jgi:hypothetical protein
MKNLLGSLGFWNYLFGESAHQGKAAWQTMPSDSSLSQVLERLATIWK